MWLRWLPWRYIVRRVARARGFVDPISVWSRLHSFAEPAEVAAPLELLRAGVVFHARGLMNTAAIQHNLDWVWPYWVERQFDPLDDAFIPRAFSITHVNLTHRNWTAIGVPDCPHLPIVDPRGLLTPWWDGWSLDCWVIGDDGARLVPSRMATIDQRLDLDAAAGLAVITSADEQGQRLRMQARVQAQEGIPTCIETVSAASAAGGWLAVTLRPTNPEGVSFIHDVSVREDGLGWRVDDARDVRFDIAADQHALSTYREGDVFARLPADDSRRQVRCDVGLCTAAALYRLEPGQTREVMIQTPLSEPRPNTRPSFAVGLPTWSDALAGHCRLSVPDQRMKFLYDAAVRTLVLHSPGEVYPGPYTYKRFWFRDAAFILHGLLAAGQFSRVKRVLDGFPARQTRGGYFLSQEGEWDSNGAALWIMRRYCELRGEPPDAAWERAITRGGEWIERKRLPDDLDKPHAGLLPAGFSAEHLGPNDFYYWDDFWSVAGLRSAAAMLETLGAKPAVQRFRQTADRLLAAIDRSLVATAGRRDRPGIPAAPYRRLDAGAIGSLAGGYPLQLWAADDPRLLATVEFLLEHCFVRGGFFQDMIHSGINPYLTLHVAQVLMRAGDPRATTLWQRVGELATSTGQWPEAIHPRTLGGCMGDGQHVWAAAEWVLMLRNCFVREEVGGGDALVLGSGLPADWTRDGTAVEFGPTPTPWGAITIRIEGGGTETTVTWTAQWRGPHPTMLVALPGHVPFRPQRGDTSARVRRA